MKIIVASGGFDPIHSGHIEYFKAARKYGDKLIVALNSDKWLENKKGKAFMPFFERREIIKNLSCVDEVIDFPDDELGSAIGALEKVKKLFPESDIYFVNGGDRNKTNIPEMAVDGVNFLFSVGGEYKKNSSSWILNKWQYYFEERKWGAFFNLFETKNIKVKELIIDPGKEISFQRHFKRNEIWLVSEGSCLVAYANKNRINDIKKTQLKKYDHYVVTAKEWHQIINPYKEAVHLIEIQFGDECIEEDIERL